MCYHILEGLRRTVPRYYSLGDVEVIHAPTYALATHLMTANPCTPKPPTQTEQFVDAPPKSMYKHEWRKSHANKQEKVNAHSR